MDGQTDGRMTAANTAYTARRRAVKIKFSGSGKYDTHYIYAQETSVKLQSRISSAPSAARDE